MTPSPEHRAATRLVGPTLPILDAWPRGPPLLSSRRSREQARNDGEAACPRPEHGRASQSAGRQPTAVVFAGMAGGGTIPRLDDLAVGSTSAPRRTSTGSCGRSSPMAARSLVSDTAGTYRASNESWSGTADVPPISAGKAKPASRVVAAMVEAGMSSNAQGGRAAARGLCGVGRAADLGRARRWSQSLRWSSTSRRSIRCSSRRPTRSTSAVSRPYCCWCRLQRRW
jgi:hypothetical protein